MVDGSYVINRKMVGNEENNCNKNNGLTNGVVKTILNNTKEYVANVTDLDLSNGKISNLCETLELPPNLVHLKVTHNKLTEVPPKLLRLDRIQTLDLSFNSIVSFDDKPSFCHTIEWLNLSNNMLEGPPLWVWTEKPNKLVYMNLSNNINICQSFTNSYFEEILQYKTPVIEIDVHNCRLSKYLKLLVTFCHAKTVCLGSDDYNYLNVNNLYHLPCSGLEECHNVEKMILSNTQIYHINSNIDIYKNLKELNLSQNNINSLPNEFINLECLETCIMSYNKLLYLPEDMYKLTNLVRLYLDNNKLCMVPETLHEIPSLKLLDLYNNNLCEPLNNINNLEEVDFAQNYLDEPDDEEYLVKKEKLRLQCYDCNRVDGRKFEVIREDSEYSKEDESYDEELNALITEEHQENQEVPNTRSSSPEDWDSDDYWIPQYYKPVTPPRSPWLFFVKKKMEEGNFCPMDAHPVSIADKVKYEKLCNPQVVLELDGQFDDYSDDDS